MKNRKKKFFDELMLLIFFILLGSLAILNICQTDRPTVSAEENRELAKMPELKWDTFWSGEYFADIGDFISDTFFGREQMFTLSKKFDTLKSLSLIHEREGINVLINPKPTEDMSEEISAEALPEFSVPPEVSEQESVPPDVIIPLKLSSSTATFTAGATFNLTATVGEGYDGLTWSVSGDSGITVTDNKDGTATVKGTSAGKATVTATVLKGGEKVDVTCDITVNAVVIADPDNVVEFLPNGLFIYDGAAYSQSFFSATNAPRFAEVYERISQMFPNTQMSVVIAPLATITITDPKETSKFSSQGDILDKMQAAITGDVNFVNLKDVYLEHADEYLFYKSDHHWTHRGAYYAYCEFAKSVGLTPVSLEKFQMTALNDKYIGSMYAFTKDERVNKFYDTIEAYLPTKDCVMTVQNQLGQENTYNFCINTGRKDYLAFINGDNPYTVINVPENPQDKSILVIKDSYGNAFVPYLTEHYGNIIVIDPRHVDMNIYEQFKDYGLSDIVFMVNTSSGNTTDWYNYLVNLLK